MRAYELMVIFSPEVEDRAVEPSLSKFLEIVTNAGGTIDGLSARQPRGGQNDVYPRPVTRLGVCGRS